MSVSVALQDLLADLLKTNSAVTAIVGNRGYDGPQPDAKYPHWNFAATDTVRTDADCISSREETVQIDCWSRDQGKLWPCKKLVDAVSGALHEQEGEMSVGALVSLDVVLTRVFLDPDGKTAHGVVQVTASIEDPV